MSQEHHLKTDIIYFQKLKTQEKTFEIRKNDRQYAVGDVLVLREWEKDYGGHFTGEEMRAEVTYMTDFMQPPGYVVLALRFLNT